ncbi:MAG: protein kinase domain-containing protein [Stenotrophomonas sp.]
MVVDREGWRQVRELFDAVCDTDPAHWRSELARLSADPAVIAETLELLHAQTRELGSAQAPLERMLGGGLESELNEGDTVGPWRLCQRLASGGMGVVFRAERADGLYAQEVAIKFLQGQPGVRAAERLAEERRILAGLQHPNIARLYDGGTTPAGNPYLVMEYIRGQPLDTYCAQQGLDLAQRLALFLKVCGAVQAAHARLVLHCDLKPSNILVRADGEPVLLDFGVSRLLDDTSAGVRAGFFTPAYAAPELQAGQASGVVSDVFSLGALLGELVAGKRGRRDGSDAGHAVTAPSARAGLDCDWRNRLRGDLDAIVVRAGALDPEQRYPSVEAMVADLQRHQQRRPVQARNGGRLYRTGRWLQRNWKGVGMLLVVLLLAAWFVWRLQQARMQAEQEAQVAQEVSDFLVSAFDAANPRKGQLRGSSEVTAREVLEASRERIEQQQWTSPLVKARLQSVLAQAFQNIGEGGAAEPLYRAAIPVLQAAGPGSRDIAAVSLNELSTLLANQQRGEESESFARQALALRAPAPSQLRVAQAYNSLGLALSAQRRFDDSAKAFDQALAMHAGLHSNALRQSTVIQNKALMYIEKGDYVLAEQMLRQVAELRRPWGTRTSEWWGGQYALMRAIAAQGRYAQALAASDEVLALALHLFGAVNDNVAMIHNERGGLQQDLGNYTEAVAEYRKALQQYEGLGVAQTMDAAITLNNLAGLEQARGDAVTARSLFERSLQIRRRTLGADEPQVWVVEANLARLLIEEGDLQQALPLIAHARAGWAGHVAPEHPRRLLAEAIWAQWQIAHGDLAAADSALASIKQHLQGGDIRVQRRYLAVLAKRQGSGGDPAAAARTLQQLVDVYVTEVGEDSVETAQQRAAYADALAAAGRCDDARLAVRKAWPALEQQLLPVSRVRQRAQALLANNACATKAAS